MYNRVIMIGNLTRDIELRYLPSGSAIAKSSIATSHRYKTQTGEQKEEVCFLEFSVFGKSGEILNQYVKKGSKVLLEGRLIYEQWTAQDGSNRNRHSLRVDNFKFLDTKSDGSAMNQQVGYNQQQPSYAQNDYNQPSYGQQGGMNSPQYNAPQEYSIPDIDINEDEIPF